MLMMATALLTIPRMMNKLVFVLSKQSTYVGQTPNPPYPFFFATLSASILHTLALWAPCSNATHAFVHASVCATQHPSHASIYPWRVSPHSYPPMHTPMRVRVQVRSATVPGECGYGAHCCVRGTGRVRCRYGLPTVYLWGTYGVPMGYLWGTYGVLLPESPTALALFLSVGLAHSCVTLPPRTPTSPTPPLHNLHPVGRPPPLCQVLGRPSRAAAASSPSSPSSSTRTTAATTWPRW